MRMPLFAAKFFASISLWSMPFTPRNGKWTYYEDQCSNSS
uniref:Uncharacterized protein n=1 Tax=Rhizophora mucronata TaxID=61149 RepID=A0A2P2PFK6_RHIMU